MESVLIVHSQLRPSSTLNQSIMNKKEIEESLEFNIQFEKRGGLVPAIAQDAETGEILMIGSANQEAFNKTLELGLATFYSTSRNELWTKGLTSGDYLEIKDILVDCDQDALIYQVIRKGNGACHTKSKDGAARRSCFYRKLNISEHKLVWKSKDLE
jgi:phosphoribosyl-AMP cyclohydrolase